MNHFLFGVLDQRDARKYDNTIKNLKNASFEGRELIRNQSKVFEAAKHFNENVFKYEDKISKLNEKMTNQSSKLD